jgi:hypothetical protein
MLFSWASGVPALASGLATASSPVIALGAALLLAGVALSAAQGLTVISASQDAGVSDSSG